MSLLSLVAALALGVVAGVAVSRRTRLGRLARRLLGALFAASVAVTLFAVGTRAGVVDVEDLPLALAYGVVSGLASVAAAWLMLRVMVGRG